MPQIKSNNLKGDAKFYKIRYPSITRIAAKDALKYLKQTQPSKLGFRHALKSTIKISLIPDWGQ